MLYSISTPNHVMRVTADSGVTIAGNLTVSGTLSTANIAAANITTTESNAGYSFMGKPVKVHAVTRTSPAEGYQVILFKH